MNKSTYISIFCIALCFLHEASATPSLSGEWKLDPTRSSALNFWNDMTLKFTIDGDKVHLTRTLSYGSNSSQEVFNLDINRPDNICPVSWYADNRYMGLFIGGDGAKHIRASWLDERRALRLDANLVVNAQQGPKKINILSDYKLSAGGNELTLIEIRSARMTPFVYIFKRADK